MFGRSVSTLFVLSALGFTATAQQARHPTRPDAERSGVVVMGAPSGSQQLTTQPFPRPPNVNTTRNGSPQNETSIAIDPDDSRNLVGGTNDYRYGDAQAGVAVSLDGGRTWTADTLDGLDTTLGKYDAQGDPAIAPYRGGVFYYAFIDFNRGDEQNRLAIAKSTDGGVTWPVLGVVIDHPGPGSHDFEDKEYIAVDATGGPFDGNVYISWTRFPSFGSTRIMFARSLDGGESYSSPVQISDSTNGYQGSVPAVGPSGELYVAWLRSNAIQVDKSTNGGMTFRDDRLVAVISPQSFPPPGALFRGNSFPTIAVDRSDGPTRGNVYVAWGDGVGTGLGPDVLFTRSTDGGLSWSDPIRVSDDQNSSYQFFPWICVAPDGTIAVVFFDQRDAPGTRFYDTRMARSFDGGLTFEKNRRVSTQTSDSFNDGFGGFFIGDYNGVTSTHWFAHPYWTDIRDATANAEGFTAAVP